MIPDEVRFHELHAKKCLQPDEEKELEEIAGRLASPTSQSRTAVSNPVYHC